MIRTIIVSGAMATLLATTGYSQEMTAVKEVDVSVDLTAIENPQAAAYWTAVGDDLENAIVARLTEQTVAPDEDGVKISIDLNEIELANSFQNAAGIAESKMIGNVSISSETDNSDFESFELTVMFEQLAPFFPEGTELAAITSDSKEYYDAMITAFADTVVTRLN